MIRPYQTKTIAAAVEKYHGGALRELFCLPTGAGKTYIFTHLTDYITRTTDRRVLVLVHREKLMDQAFSAFTAKGIPTQRISQATARVNIAHKAFVGMVQTTKNRLVRNPHLIPRLGLVIVDEAHRADFVKFIDMIPDVPVFGFTATPISADVKRPLNTVFNGITLPTTIPELVAENYLCPVVHVKAYALTETETKTLSVAKGDFSEKTAAQLFEGTAFVDRCFEAYNMYCTSHKTLIFNVSIAHSELVKARFLAAGVSVEAMDSSIDKARQAEIMAWFEATPGAVLLTVDMVTTGVDVPSITRIIINRPTRSLPLWFQMNGRGSRLHPNKDTCLSIDLGGNVDRLGLWSQDIDWHAVFHSAEPYTPGPPETKQCPACHAEVLRKNRECQLCGHEFPAEPYPLGGSATVTTTDDIQLGYVVVNGDYTPEPVAPAPEPPHNFTRWAQQHIGIAKKRNFKPPWVVFAAAELAAKKHRDIAAAMFFFRQQYITLCTLMPSIYKDNPKDALFWEGKISTLIKQNTPKAMQRG